MSRKGESSNNKSSKSGRTSKSTAGWTNDPNRVMKTSVGRRSAAESRSTPLFDLGGSDDNVAKVFQHLGSVAKSAAPRGREGGGGSGQSSKRGGKRRGNHSK